MKLSNLRLLFPAALDTWALSCAKDGFLAPFQRMTGIQWSSSSAAVEPSKDEPQVNSDDDVHPKFVNRNPRNLEMMGLAQKRQGWKFQYPPREFYHRLLFERTNRHISAHVEHSSGATVVSATTRELAIMKHLYSTSDVSAAVNIGRILAQRCQESGIYNMVLLEPESGTNSAKFEGFRTALQEAGIVLTEPDVITREYLPGIDYDNQEEVDELVQRQKRVAQLGRWSGITYRVAYMRKRSRNMFNGRPKSKVHYV